MTAGSMEAYSGAADWEVFLEYRSSFSCMQQNCALGIPFVITFQESILLQAWYIWQYKSTPNWLFYLVEILEYILRHLLSSASISRSCMFQEAESGTREFITHISTSQQHVLTLLWMKQTTEFESPILQKCLWLFPLPCTVWMFVMSWQQYCFDAMLKAATEWKYDTILLGHRGKPKHCINE